MVTVTYLSPFKPSEPPQHRLERNASRDFWTASYRFQACMLKAGAEPATIRKLESDWAAAHDEATKHLSEKQIKTILSKTSTKAVKDFEAGICTCQPH